MSLRFVRSSLVLMLGWWGAISALLAATIHVPGDYLTIQEAIDAALPGDVIVVAPGCYRENVDFHGKGVKVRSRDGPEVTILDGGGKGSVVWFVNGENRRAVLEGFTITNGSGTLIPGGWLSGGGILCFGASPTIKENRILGNRAAGHGGGIACLDGAAPLIMNNAIFKNLNGTEDFAPGWGGGIGVARASPRIEGNAIYENQVTRGGGGIFCKYSTDGHLRVDGNAIHHNVSAMRAGGLYISLCAYTTVTNNRIFENRSPMGAGFLYADSMAGRCINNTFFGNMTFGGAGHGGGILCDKNSDLLLVNSILWKNEATVGAEIYVGKDTLPSHLEIHHSCVEGGFRKIHQEPGASLRWGPGMIQQPPRFLDPVSGDFHLLYDSPCRDGGDRDLPDLPSLDFEVDPRKGNHDGFPGIPDLGADEFFIHLSRSPEKMDGRPSRLYVWGGPGSHPVALWFSLDLLQDPLEGGHGDWWNRWYLDFSASLVGPLWLRPIPEYGVITVEGFPSWQYPELNGWFVQGMVGKSLTNCLPPDPGGN